MSDGLSIVVGLMAIYQSFVYGKVGDLPGPSYNVESNFPLDRCRSETRNVTINYLQSKKAQNSYDISAFPCIRGQRYMVNYQATATCAQLWN